MDQIRKRIKLGSASRNNEVHKQVITSLKSMMWERSRSAFTDKLREFYSDFGVYTDIIVYFKKQYLINDAFMKWSAAYQPQIFTNMETNNYVESWHNQLKSTYLQRKRNRRIDRLIYILVNDVEKDYMHNTRRIALNIARMGPTERHRRRRELLAEEVPETLLEDMIEMIDGSCVQVKSFNQDDISYIVAIEANVMKSCTCNDFTWHQLACKHMY
ncbi:hypothetical protein DFQ28_010461 [Apophysomyces sp. BC1034]|nr:hypothetical protein DFQ28_010461 [Apophysomyces sp. BC1034]